MRPDLYSWSKEELQIIKAAWSTDHGRLALNVVVERLAGLMTDQFDKDPYVHARNAGRRSVGVDLMRAINLKVEQLVQEPHEPRTGRIRTATERAERAVSGEPAPKLR